MAESSTAKRKSLTKAQLATEAGAELLSLCQTATADGSLSKEEIVELRKWLYANRKADLPSISYLLEVVEGIVADGVVTPAERRDLFKAIESVLPADVRGIARSARRNSEDAAKERLRVIEDQRRAAVKEEKERNRPLQTWDFMIAGAKYEGRPSIIRRHAHVGDNAVLLRDPSNKHSRNAVQVRTISGHHIGFVPEEDAIELAPYLDGGHLYSAKIKKILSGSSHLIPVVVAAVHGEGCTLTGLSEPAAVTASAPTHSAGGRSWPSITVGLIVLAITVTLIRSCS